jgi:micrococcal nuclease
MANANYNYNAKLLRVVDGDTVDALIDLGFNTWVKKRIRLYGIDTPETRTRDKEEKKKGLAAKERLKEILAECNNEFILSSHGIGKYGRCLGELFINSGNINQQLITEGHAVKYE